MPPLLPPPPAPAALASPANPVAATPTDADLHDLFVPAPLALVVRVTAAIPLRDARAGPGLTRMYLTGEVARLLRGPAEGLAPRVAWLADVPADARGRVPRLKGATLLLAARAVPERPGEVRLVAPDAQRPWDAGVEARVRALLAAALAPDAFPPVTGVTGAFHVAGTLPGESETQLFLAAADGRPRSITVLRRPGAAPRWSLSAGGPGSLAALRLRCGLPPALPAAATSELTPADTGAAAEDYRLVLAELGPCTRSR